MSKVSLRICMEVKVKKTSEPISLDMNEFKSANPPFDGENEEQFLKYICDNLEDWMWEKNPLEPKGFGVSQKTADKLYSLQIENGEGYHAMSEYDYEDLWYEWFESGINKVEGIPEHDDDFQTNYKTERYRY